ncbi:hypothetical protein [Glycomyces sp. NPDC048151]|uniref:hypothetical protein n=1 Tax=Glycomyces sp. NPDC048151 TaxID=3364002 RepID=UPI0037157A72
MSTEPRYVNNSTIARRFNVHHVTVIGWRKKYPPEHQQVPTPAPAAFVVEKFGAEIPLWDEAQLLDWDDWYAAFRAYSQINRVARMRSLRADRGAS